VLSRVLWSRALVSAGLVSVVLRSGRSALGCWRGLRPAAGSSGAVAHRRRHAACSSASCHRALGFLGPSLVPTPMIASASRATPIFVRLTRGQNRRPRSRLFEAPARSAIRIAHWLRQCCQHVPHAPGQASMDHRRGSSPRRFPSSARPEAAVPLGRQNDELGAASSPRRRGMAYAGSAIFLSRVVVKHLRRRPERRALPKAQVGKSSDDRERNPLKAGSYQRVK